MKTLRTFLASKHGQLLEHYAIVFAGSALAVVFASSQNLDGVHGIHALAAAMIGIGATAVKAGYDAVRQLAIPALLAWFARRGVNASAAAPVAPPTLVVAPEPATSAAAKKKAAAKKPPAAK